MTSYYDMATQVFFCHHFNSNGQCSGSHNFCRILLRNFTHALALLNPRSLLILVKIGSRSRSGFFWKSFLAITSSILKVETRDLIPFKILFQMNWKFRARRTTLLLFIFFLTGFVSEIGRGRNLRGQKLFRFSTSIYMTAITPILRLIFARSTLEA